MCHATLLLGALPARRNVMPSVRHTAARTSGQQLRDAHLGCLRTRSPRPQALLHALAHSRTRALTHSHGGAGAARPVLIAELYRLGCLVDPMLAAVTDDDDDNGRGAQASPAAAAQPPQSQPQRTVSAVRPPDDTLSPDDVPTRSAHRPRSAEVLSRVPQSADLRPQTPDANGRPQTAAPLGALGRGVRSVPPTAACVPPIPAPRPLMQSPLPAPTAASPRPLAQPQPTTTKAPPLMLTKPQLEPGMVSLSNQQYRTATFGRRPGGSGMWVWPPVHRSSVQPMSEWTIEPAEPPPPAQHGQKCPPPPPHQQCPSARARLLRLLTARLIALGGSALPGGEVRPLGAPQLPRVLESAASYIANTAAFDRFRAFLFLRADGAQRLELMASRVTKRGAPSSGALERGGVAPKKAPPAGQLFAPAASGATGIGPDPEPEPTPEPASVPRWEPPPDIADIEEGAEEATSKGQAVEEAVIHNKQLTCLTAPLTKPIHFTHTTYLYYTSRSPAATPCIQLQRHASSLHPHAPPCLQHPAAHIPG